MKKIYGKQIRDDMNSKKRILFFIISTHTLINVSFIRAKSTKRISVYLYLCNSSLKYVGGLCATPNTKHYADLLKKKKTENKFNKACIS